MSELICPDTEDHCRYKGLCEQIKTAIENNDPARGLSRYHDDIPAEVIAVLISACSLQRLQALNGYASSDNESEDSRNIAYSLGRQILLSMSFFNPKDCT